MDKGTGLHGHAGNGAAHRHGNGRHGAHAATKENPAPGSGPFGLALFLVTLAVLFAGSLVAYAVIRSRAPEWPPPGFPPVPSGLWVGTAFLAAASFTLEASVRALAPYRAGRLRAALAASLGMGFAFLISQTVCAVQFLQGMREPHLYTWLVLFLTGLHAAHVIGGLVPLVIATVKAYHGLVPPPGSGGGDIRATAVYWHFLGLVWVTLFGVLLLTT